MMMLKKINQRLQSAITQSKPVKTVKWSDTEPKREITETEQIMNKVIKIK